MYLVKALPSTRTTIHVLGNKGSGRSKSRTYSKREFAMADRRPCNVGR